MFFRKKAFILGIFSNFLTVGTTVAIADTVRPPENCSSFTPLENTVSPTVPESTERIIDRPNSNCAGDLTGLSFPEIAEKSPENPLPQEMPVSGTIDTSAGEESQGWRVYFQPYVTIPVSTYGQVEIKGKTVNYSLGLGQLLEVLRVTASGRVEAWNGNFGLIFDGYYVSLGGTGIRDFNPRQPTRTRPDFLPDRERERPTVEASLESNLKFDQGIYDFAVSYHLGERPIVYNPELPSSESFPRFWFAPYVGTRLNDISSTVETNFNIPRVGRIRESSVSDGRTWFEPLLGGKMGLQLSEPFTLWLRGDASGFGTAGETNMSWNVIFGLDWWVYRQLSLQFAYRFYSINYGNGSGKNAFRFEENFNGPYLSATFRF